MTMDEAGTKTADIFIDGMHCDSCVGTIRNALESEEGVQYAHVTFGKAQVRYLPYVITIEYLREKIEDSGYTIHSGATRKGFFGRYIDKMIASNQKNYGDQRLDCCSLAKEDAAHKPTRTG